MSLMPDDSLFAAFGHYHAGRHIPCDSIKVGDGVNTETLAASVLLWWHIEGSDPDEDWEWLALSVDEADAIADALHEKAGEVRRNNPIT